MHALAILKHRNMGRECLDCACISSDLEGTLYNIVCMEASTNRLSSNWSYSLALH